MMTILFFVAIALLFFVMVISRNTIELQQKRLRLLSERIDIVWDGITAISARMDELTKDN